MRRHQISCPLVFDSIPDHDLHKNDILLKIKESGGQLISNEGNSGITSVITSGDYFRESERLYEPLFFEIIGSTPRKLLEQFICIESDSAECQLQKPWYQQYYNGDTHSWHDHTGGSSFSFIYYLELPEGTPGTEFLDPWSGCIHTPEVKEGDLLVFPSFVLHRSPPNQSDKRKTIISVNVT